MVQQSLNTDENKIILYFDIWRANTTQCPYIVFIALFFRAMINIAHKKEGFYVLGLPMMLTGSSLSLME